MDQEIRRNVLFLIHLCPVPATRILRSVYRFEFLMNERSNSQSSIADAGAAKRGLRYWVIVTCHTNVTRVADFT